MALVPHALAANLPIAGLGAAKLLVLAVVIALPLILVVGTLLRRGRSR